MDVLTPYYSHTRHHTGIGLYTAADVRYSLTDAFDLRRPGRRPRCGPRTVDIITAPKMLSLPETAWIDPPIPEPKSPNQWLKRSPFNTS